MTKRLTSVSKIIFLIFLSVFVIASLPLLLYANGWRWNNDTKHPERISSLALKIQPPDVSVTVDGVYYKFGSTVHGYQTISSIDPGLRTIVISQPGFLSWQETLEFRSGETKFLNDVQLFPQTTIESAPLPLSTTATLIRSKNSPLPDVLAVTKNNSTTLHRLSPKPKLGLETITAWDMSLVFAEENDGSYLLRSTNDVVRPRWFVVNDSTVTSVYALFPFSFSQVTFNLGKRDQFLAADRNRLLLLDVEKKTIRQLIQLDKRDTILDILPRQNYLYLLLAHEQQTWLVVLSVNPDNQINEFSRWQLPALRTPKFRPSPAQILTIFDPATNILALVALEREIPTTTALLYDVTGTESTPTNNALLWWKNKTLWRTELRSLQHTPLTTFSESILAIVNDPTTPTHYVATAHEVTAINFINDQNIHQTNLLSMPAMSAIMPTTDGAAIIVTTPGSAQNQAGLLRRPLR